MTNCPPSGCGQSNVTHFYIWGSGHIFEADKAKGFKFGKELDGNDYYHMHVKILQYGGVLVVT